MDALVLVEVEEVVIARYNHLGARRQSAFDELVVG